MREIYIEILKILAERGQSIKWHELAQFLVAIDDEDAPERDQDIEDLLGEFYAFVVSGYIPERINADDTIKSWGDLRQRIAQLEQVSPN